MATEERKVTCPSCGAAADGAFCPSCGARIEMGDVRIHVEGRDADEVERVARQLAADEAKRASEREAKTALRSPWIAGSFYLVTLIVSVVLLLVVASTLPLWALPVVAVGGLVGLVLVGTLQLRQDDRLSESGFVALATLTIKQLPLLIGRRGKR